MDQLILSAVQHWPGLELREWYQDFYIDVALEQKMLLHSQAIVLLYAMQWGLPPALLVQYLHRVFQYGWAYGRNAAADPVMSLQGKTFWLVTHAVAQCLTPGYVTGRKKPPEGGFSLLVPSDR